MIHSRSLQILAIILMCTLIEQSCARHSWTKFTPASFVPPAAPTVITSIPGRHHRHTAKPHAKQKITLQETFTIEKKTLTSTCLASKKKSSGGGTTVSSTKKVQVKLLKHVAGTGQAGDIIMVAPAFFQNKLRPTKSAELISDEKVEREKEEAKAIEKRTREKANELKERLKDFKLTLTMKAGPEGQLFGGIHARNILEELRKTVNDDFIESKGVTVKAITDTDGNKMKTDIKHIGEYTVTLSLTKEITASFLISVRPES